MSKVRNALDKAVKVKAPVLTSIGAALTAFFMNAYVSFAAEDIFKTIKETLDTYYKQFVLLSTTIMLFVVVVGVIWIMISPSSKGAQTPLDWIKKVVIAWIIIQLLGSIFILAQKVTGNSHNQQQSIVV